MRSQLLTCKKWQKFWRKMRRTSPLLVDQMWGNPVSSIVCWVSTWNSSYVSSPNFFFFFTHSFTHSHSFFSYRLFSSFYLTNSPILSLPEALPLAHFHTHTHTLLLPILFYHHLIPFSFSHLIPSSGTDRSIVSDVAGTTRDTVDALVVRYIRSDFVCTITPSYFIICFIHFISSLFWLTISDF